MPSSKARRLHKHRALLGILLLGAAMRFVLLGSSPLLGDEPFTIVRASGWIDTFDSELQQTPLDWFPALPWWSYLSFHDHPPLILGLVHIAARAFGDGLFALRIPSALMSTLSVLLIYILAQAVFKDEKIALTAAALAAANNFLIFFGRSGMLEAGTIFFILLAAVCFLAALRDDRLLPVFGAALGLSLLAKYTALFALPAYGIAVLLYKKNWLRAPRFYIALGLAALVLSPMLIYNTGLYKTRGHFDLQWSFALGQNPQEWQNLPGKEKRGGILHRITDETKLIRMVSPVFSLLAISGLLLLFILFIKKENRTQEKTTLLLLTVSYLAMPLFIGAFDRFLVYVIPFLITIAAFQLNALRTLYNIRSLAIFILGYEFFFSFNSSILHTLQMRIPVPHILYAYELATTKHELLAVQKYLELEFSGKTSAIALQTPAARINQMIAKAQMRQHGDKENIVLVYDSRLLANERLWIPFRLLVYRGWPAVHLADTGSLASLTDIYPQAQIWYIHKTQTQPEDEGLVLPGSSHPDTVATELRRMQAAAAQFPADSPAVFEVFKITADEFQTALNTEL